MKKLIITIVITSILSGINNRITCGKNLFQLSRNKSIYHLFDDKRYSIGFMVSPGISYVCSDKLLSIKYFQNEKYRTDLNTLLPVIGYMSYLNYEINDYVSFLYGLTWENKGSYHAIAKIPDQNLLYYTNNIQSITIPNTIKLHTKLQDYRIFISGGLWFGWIVYSYQKFFYSEDKNQIIKDDYNSGTHEIGCNFSTGIEINCKKDFSYILELFLSRGFNSYKLGEQGNKIEFTQIGVRFGISLNLIKRNTKCLTNKFRNA